MGLVYAQHPDGSVVSELSACGLAHKLPYAFELSSVLFFLAPWTLIVVLYILIGLKLYKSKRDSSRTTCSAHCRHTACLSSTSTRATGRVVKMLGKSGKGAGRRKNVVYSVRPPWIPPIGLARSRRRCRLKRRRTMGKKLIANTLLSIVSFEISRRRTILFARLVCKKKKTPPPPPLRWTVLGYSNIFHARTWT